ncbi:hypothetical protein QVA66_09540 [Staphylococcus chromogenes]|nr:hypothetical protein [Staphylococcus chromogenes]
MMRNRRFTAGILAAVTALSLNVSTANAATTDWGDMLDPYKDKGTNATQLIEQFETKGPGAMLAYPGALENAFTSAELSSDGESA